MSETPSWNGSQPDESFHSGAGQGGPWDGWDEFAPGLGEDEFWDAFEIDDVLEEPEPERGDFWVEPRDDEEEVV